MPIKRVFSAGGIVLRHFAPQDKLLTEDEVKVLVSQHSGHHGWDFPKGHLEVGESSEQAALREVEEETGVKAEIIQKAGQTHYFYWEPSSKKVSDGKQKVFKTVTFFLMKYVEEGKATTADEVSAMKWLPVDEVEVQLTFKDTKGLWQEAKSIVKRLRTKD